MKIETEAQLREIYGDPIARVMRKNIAALETHSRHFIELSPFVVLATAGKNGGQDSSPRGGRPGFVHIENNTTLLLPDLKGNNLLDSHINIIETGRVGCVFMIPGIDEVLRVNGRAEIRTDVEYLSLFCDEKRPPLAVIKIDIDEVFLHCAKALMRAQLWNPQSQVDRALFPPLGQMVNDQLGESEAVESHEAMVARYRRLI